MKSMRFFVTAVLFVSTAVLMACDAYRSAHKASESESAKQKGPSITDGNLKLGHAQILQLELAQAYSIFLDDMRDPNGKVVKAATMAGDYQWRRLTRAQRKNVKEVLFQFLALSNEALSVDAREGVYMTNKERVVGQRNAATAFQKYLEEFENIFGENFEPKAGGDLIPPYAKTLEI